jgi:adenosylcobinamide-phosphate synthase
VTTLQIDFQTLAYGPGVIGLCLMALVLDVMFGTVPALRRLVPHPALLMASLIGGLASKLNRRDRGPAARLVRGLLVELVVVCLALMAGYALEKLTLTIPFFWLISLLLLTALTILRGPFDEVGLVTKGYLSGGLAGARQAAASVIGPEATHLNEAQIYRALAEHLAGRFADGLVAGVFWLLLLGLPGFLLWRTINIAGRLLDDSQPETAQFGLIATRVNEAFGLLPAWLAAMTLCLAAAFVPGASPPRALAAMFGKNNSHGRHSERVAIATTLAALTIPDKTSAMTGPDVVRAQMLYGIACLLVFAMIIIRAMIR